MDLDELNLDIKIEVTSIKELREIREELQKIARSKKEIDVSEEDDTGLDPLDPIDLPDPRPKREPHPRFPDYPKKKRWFICDTEQETGFDTSFEVNLFDEGEPFSNVGQMDQEILNDGQMR